MFISPYSHCSHHGAEVHGATQCHVGPTLITADRAWISSCKGTRMARPRRDRTMVRTHDSSIRADCREKFLLGSGGVLTTTISITTVTSLATYNNIGSSAATNTSSNGTVAVNAASGVADLSPTNSCSGNSCTIRVRIFPFLCTRSCGASRLDPSVTTSSNA